MDMAMLVNGVSTMPRARLRRRLITAVAGSAVLALGAPAGPLGAAVAQAPAVEKPRLMPPPVVTSVRPKRAKLGEEVLIIGDNFRRGANANTVYFKRGKGVVWSKGTGLDRHTISVRLPGKLVAAMAAGSGRLRTSTFTVRVRADRTGVAFTRSIRLAVEAPPPGDCDRDGLDDALERQVGTDFCTVDTDGDKLTDYYEYSAAKAGNGGVYPFPSLFPTKRPIPNPILADTDGDKVPDNREDSDTDGLRAEVEQEMSQLAPQMPACASSNGGTNLFLNDIATPRINYNDGLKDSDGDGLVDGGTVYVEAWSSEGQVGRYLLSGGENLDCDGWVPRITIHVPPKEALDEGEGKEDSKKNAEKHWWMSYDKAQTAACKSPSATAAECQLTYEELLACRTEPPTGSDVYRWVWLDNRAEATAMRQYGNPFDPDTDGDGLPDGCDDVDHDGYSNALEIYVMRQQKLRSIDFVDGNEPTKEEGKWDPLDACKPGPELAYLHEPPPGCNPDPEGTPAGPLGPDKEAAPDSGNGGGGSGSGGSGGSGGQS